MKKIIYILLVLGIFMNKLTAQIGKPIGVEPEGNTMQKPIVTGTFGNTFSYTDTQDTQKEENGQFVSVIGFTNNYGRSTNDVFHQFIIACPMEIEISHCGSVLNDTYMYLLNESGTQITYNDDSSYPEKCSNRYQSFIKTTLQPGTYYVVSEGYSQNGVIAITIEGKSLLTTNSTTINAQENNVIIIRTPLVSVSTTDNLKIDKCLQDMQYFDGLGRLQQTLQVGISPTGKDLVQLQEYDGWGRESVSWLPAPIAANYGKKIDPAQIKENAVSLHTDNMPYSKVEYEQSPLSRVVNTYAPGMDWYNNEKPIKVNYKSNTTSGRLFCAFYKVDGDGLRKTGNYNANELYVTEAIDEDGNPSYEFKNKTGQLLLTRSIDPQHTSDTYNSVFFYDTYYVYDDFGNLRYVLPPMLSEKLNAVAAWADENENIKQYAFVYKYDHLDRCIKKKLPGCEWIYYVYDRVDQLVLSQDGEQRLQQKWAFNMYDKSGRIITSGLAPTTKPHQTLINECAKITVQDNPGSGPFGHKYNSNGLPLVLGFNGWTDMYNAARIVYYYDNYDLIQSQSPRLYFDESYPCDRYYDADNKTYSAKGQLVGTLDFYDNDNNYTIKTIMFYDGKGRMVQKKVTNIWGGDDTEFITYNHASQPVKQILKHTAPDVSVTTPRIETYEYTYDHAGRLVKTTHKQDNNNPVILADNKYDESGRLQETKVNNQNKLKTSYTYNVRSWITGISNNNFWQNLYYNNKYNTGTPCYNGNISAVQWINVEGISTNDAKYFLFKYDFLSQLKEAQTGNATAMNSATRFASTYQYDKHGNMVSFERIEKGMKNVNSGGLITRKAYTELIDDVELAYTGNELKFAHNHSQHDNPIFDDYTGTSVEYNFNKNGSMTQDHNRGVVNTYDPYSGMPKKTSVNNSLAKGVNQYVYTSTGEKIYVRYYTATNKLITPGAGIELTVNETTAPDKTMAYISNKVYENGGLKRILIDNGYIENGNYYFYIKDHLGNNRVVADANGTVVQRTDYFPFGTPFPTNTNEAAQPYKFGGKEYDTMHGLDQYDFHARQMDGIRFTSVDPMAEKYYNWSPYVYCMNNPMKYIDPTGEDVYLLIWFSSTGETGHAGIAIDNYKEEVVKDKNGKPIKDKNGKIQTKYVKDGTMTYYDLFPYKQVEDTQFQKDVTPDYSKGIRINSLSDLKYGDPTGQRVGEVSPEGRAADGIVQLGTSFEQDAHMAMYANFEVDLGTKYNASSFNCSTFAEEILKISYPNLDASQYVKVPFHLRIYYEDTRVVAPNNLYNATMKLTGAKNIKGPKSVVAKPYLQYYGK